ncbi:ankyrin repeat domain-containing protein [Aromatoleum evansii]|uniref:Ankyrin repeat domain-containing protein n=1 Tax=Aromatoleum evansii TaxID=59406 RepID=A0ABZ1ALV7_AROEV|nr:ankyrin repeat domain-containing protein [Aromatoleum evansii]NMG30635.1 TIR domain-containing protein [Aromatoleum evansii]WRL46840.1 ankyrin repeat domain-containing protein [Aromatoleum evansii]
MASPVIFISYRRDDASGDAGRIFDRLVEQFGRERVFRDVDAIPAGEDFVEAIRRKIEQADVLLVLIGKQWLTATDDAGHWRLADDKDFVRTEIVSALRRGMRVIPVLLEDAEMPRAQDLPGGLAPLAQRNAFEIRNASFDRDLAELIRILAPGWRHKLFRILRQRPLQAAVALAAALLAGLWAYPLVVDTPDKVRVRINQMGLAWDPATFVELAEKNDADAVALYLRAGMPVDSVDANAVNVTALMRAARAGHVALVKLLVKHGADVNRALPWAAGAGRAEVLELLLAQQPSREAINRAMVAAADTDLAVLKRLLDLGAAVDYREDGGDTALGYAAGALKLDAARELLARGANPNPDKPDGWLPLHRAVYASRQEGKDLEHQLELVQLLLDEGAQLEARTRSMSDWQPTPLLLALHKPAPELALFLIERGADVNAASADRSGIDGQSALMVAATGGQAAVVDALLARDAAIGARNGRGETALMAAAGGYGDAQMAIARRLLDAGAELDARSDSGSTPLIRAAGSRNDVLPLLLERGAAVNATTKNGWTALMVAAQVGNDDYVRALLARGANARVLNEDGESAASLAAKGGYNRVLRTLGAPPVRAAGDQ